MHACILASIHCFSLLFLVSCHQNTEQARATGLKFSHAAMLAALSAAQPAQSQSVTIPTEVIQECNVEANASTFPDCLKDGALAFAMLQLAQTTEFYGESASQVVEACRASNTTFHGTWTCFKLAAEKAAETRQLIGVENISDTCVAGISDGEIHTRLVERYEAERRAMDPEFWSGGGMYFPFRGCDETSE